MQIYLYIDNKKHLLSGVIRLAKSKKYLKIGANLMIYHHTDENNNLEIQCKFGDVIRELGICRLLKESNICKKKGGSAYGIFQFLLLVFQNFNLFHFLNSKKQDMAFSKNTYYRFLNEL